MSFRWAGLNRTCQIFLPSIVKQSNFIRSYTTSNNIIYLLFINLFNKSILPPKATETVVTRLLTEPKRIKLRERLQGDIRFRITKEEYHQLAKESGFQDEKEADEFLATLDKAAVVNYFPQANNFVFLQPDRMTKYLLDILDPETAETQQLVNNLRQELQIKKKSAEELNVIKKKIDEKAEKSVSRILWVSAGGLIIHAVAVARLTWWELSWDIMEPITYLITFYTSVCVFIYFCVTKREYNYSSLADEMIEKRKLKLYKKLNFDIAGYNDITSRVANINVILQDYEPWDVPPYSSKLRIEELTSKE